MENLTAKVDSHGSYLRSISRVKQVTVESLCRNQCQRNNTYPVRTSGNCFAFSENSLSKSSLYDYLNCFYDEETNIFLQLFTILLSSISIWGHCLYRWWVCVYMLSYRENLIAIMKTEWYGENNYWQEISHSIEMMIVFTPPPHPVPTAPFSEQAELHH